MNFSQLKVLESRAVDNVHKNSITYHASLIKRLSVTQHFEAEIYNSALTWNHNGSLLMSGGDDELRIWSYPDGKLIYNFPTGRHYKPGILSAKFIVDEPNKVVCGGVDKKVQIFDLNDSRQLASYECHLNRVQDVAVVEGIPQVIWSASGDGTIRKHDFREVSHCDSRHCHNIQLDLRNAHQFSLGEEPQGHLWINSFDINPMRPYSILVGGKDNFARLFDVRAEGLSSIDYKAPQPLSVQYYCPKHLSNSPKSTKEITHVAFKSDGLEALINYRGEHVYLIHIKQERLKKVVNEEYGADEYQAEEYDNTDKDVAVAGVVDRDGNDFYDSHMYGGYRSSESEYHISDDDERGSSEGSDWAYGTVDTAFDIKQRFVGHLNFGTQKKEANFIGKEGEYIACGSDDGMLYVFEKHSGQLVSRRFGHKYAVICVQSHPTELAIATSGIGTIDQSNDLENIVKIWTPHVLDCDQSLTQTDLDGVEENQQNLRDGHNRVLPRYIKYAIGRGV